MTEPGALFAEQQNSESIEDGTIMSLREWNMNEIAHDQHDKIIVLIVKELLYQIRTVLRTHSEARQFRVSVSSLDPAFADASFYWQADTVERVLQMDLPEIQVRTEYEFCWYGGVSGGLCCSSRRPRHRLIAHVTVV